MKSIAFMLNNLIGVWISDPEDFVTQQLHGNVIMVFQENGELIYTVVEYGKEQNLNELGGLW